jgi:hypothetical protein
MSLEKLKVEIELKRAALKEEQQRLARLREEIGSFARQYERLVGPLEARLDALQDELSRWRGGGNTGGMWGQYASFEEAFDAKYRRNVQDTHGPNAAQRAGVTRPVSEESLRSLYRKLVRRYHPDSTQNADEKARFTVIMAQINAAWRARDVNALYALDGQKVAQPAPDVSRLDQITTLTDLMELSRRLDAEITDVQIEYRQLMTSPLMQLKIEQSLARARGGNILRELANRVQAEIDHCEAQLRKLRP